MKRKLDKAGFEEIVARCSFNDWTFVIGEDRRAVFYLQVRAVAKDNITGKIGVWTGRKWSLSPFMTPSEVVQTALKAVMTATEHEVREQFLYRGLAIYDPHYDVDKLHALRGEMDCLDEREAPPI